jgi:hypothetical protein
MRGRRESVSQVFGVFCTDANIEKEQGEAKGYNKKTKRVVRKDEQEPRKCTT